MSHQVKQVGKVAVVDLEIFARACEAVHVPELHTSQKLDRVRKTARFYAGMDDPCDAVVTFARELNAREKQQYYEVALKHEAGTPEKGSAPAVPEHYGLWADTNGADHTINRRVKELMQAYRIEELKQEGQYVGATSVVDIEGKPGWKRVRVEIPS